MGRACASSRLATWPSTSRKLFSHSVSRSVSAVSSLPSIGQENFVRAMVFFSLGMVSKVWNPLTIGQGLTKVASPTDSWAISFSSSLVRPLMVFSSSLRLSLSGLTARAQLIWDVLEGLLKTEIVWDFSRQRLSLVGPRYPRRLMCTKGLIRLCEVYCGSL